MLNARLAGLLQNSLGALAVSHQLVPFDRQPLAGVARTVQMKPLPFAPAGIERGLGADLVCHGHHQVLLFRRMEAVREGGERRTRTRLPIAWS